VRDWRLHQIAKLSNIELYRESKMTADDVIATGIAHVAAATGSRWRTDGRGRSCRSPVASYADPRTVSPEAVIAGAALTGPVVVFDDDHYYLGSTLAEFLVRQGLTVTYVTSAGKVSEWAVHTAEQARSHARLLDLGVSVITNSTVSGLGSDSAVVRCVFSGQEREIACAGFVPVTSREPDDALWRSLAGRGLATLALLGDARAPGLIAHAVHAGHRFAREFGEAAPVALRDRAVAGP